MMSLTDILELVVLCALIFMPAGYYLHKFSGRIKNTFRLKLFRPRYVKPTGVIHRQGNKNK